MKSKTEMLLNIKLSEYSPLMCERLVDWMSKGFTSFSPPLLVIILDCRIYMKNRHPPSAIKQGKIDNHGNTRTEARNAVETAIDLAKIFPKGTWDKHVEVKKSTIERWRVKEVAIN